MASPALYRRLLPMSPDRGHLHRWLWQPLRTPLLLATLLMMALAPWDARASAPSAAPGTWSVTGSMHAARYAQTATLLRSGEVLVAGGFNGLGSPLASAELYDPATGAWRLIDSMGAARGWDTATLLRSGQVLAVGGCCDDTGVNGLASAEIYDPRTGTWSPTGSMSTTRSSQTAVLLDDGRVLVSGGSSTPSAFFPLASAETYDPATGTWSPTGSMTVSREYHTATLLRSGQVLVAGGITYEPGKTVVLSSAELYDPRTGLWTATGSMHSPRQQHTATLLQSGQVLVTGGCSDGYCSNFLSSAEVYDPRTGTWSTVGNMTTARVYHTATRLLSGQVLVAGGCCSTAGTELYDPGTRTFSATGNMTIGRYEQTATLLPTGQVLATGGVNACGVSCSALARAELYSAPSSASSAPASGTTASSGDRASSVGL